MNQTLVPPNSPYGLFVMNSAILNGLSATQLLIRDTNWEAVLKTLESGVAPYFMKITGNSWQFGGPDFARTTYTPIIFSEREINDPDLNNHRMRYTITYAPYPNNTSSSPEYYNTIIDIANNRATRDMVHTGFLNWYVYLSTSKFNPKIT